MTTLAEFLVMTLGPLLLWGACGALIGAAIGYVVVGGWSATIITAAFGLVIGGAIDLIRQPDE